MPPTDRTSLSHYGDLQPNRLYLQPGHYDMVTEAKTVGACAAACDISPNCKAFSFHSGGTQVRGGAERDS